MEKMQKKIILQFNGFLGSVKCKNSEHKLSQITLVRKIDLVLFFHRTCYQILNYYLAPYPTN